MNDARARDLIEAFFARESTAKAWGLELVDCGEGWAKVAMTVRPDMLNGHGTLHGGMIFSLAGTAFAYAANASDAASVAQHASINFLAPAHAGDRLIAESRKIAVEGRAGVFESVVRAADGRTIAVAQGLMRTIGGGVVDMGDDHG